jgi:hypothetical protein
MSTQNLTVHRSGSLDRSADLASIHRKRLVLGLAASALGLVGMRRRGIRALLFMLASTALYRAASGHDDLARLRSWLARVRDRGPDRSEPVTEAGAPFPASDLPAWTPTVGSI